MIGDTPACFLDGDHDSGDGTRGEKRRSLALSTREFEDLETVLGNGDANALEKLVVEVGNVFVFELVLGEGKAVFVDETWFEICSRQP